MGKNSSTASLDQPERKVLAFAAFWLEQSMELELWCGLSCSAVRLSQIYQGVRMLKKSFNTCTFGPFEEPREELFNAASGALRRLRAHGDKLTPEQFAQRIWLEESLREVACQSVDSERGLGRLRSLVSEEQVAFCHELNRKLSKEIEEDDRRFGSDSAAPTELDEAGIEMLERIRARLKESEREAPQKRQALLEYLLAIR